MPSMTNPVTRLAGILSQRGIPDADALAITASEALAASLTERYSHSESAEWLQASADLHRHWIQAPR